jgi:hypothetical protein
LVAGWSAAPAAWKAPFEGTLVAGWSAVPGALVMHAKKGRTSTFTGETLIVLLQLLVYTFCNFKGNEIHIRYMLQIHLLFFLDFFSFGFAFLYCNHVGVFFFVFKVDLKESICLMQVYFLQSLYLSLSLSIGTLQVNSSTVVYFRYWFF